VFKRSSQSLIKHLAEELLQDATTRNGTYPTIAVLVNDQFGNYVIQTLLESSSGTLREQLLSSLSKCVKLNKHGKKLSAKVGQMLRKGISDVSE